MSLPENCGQAGTMRKSTECPSAEAALARVAIVRDGVFGGWGQCGDEAFTMCPTSFRYANDDIHYDCDIGVGWNMVYAAERSREGIVSALKSERFYASTGVVIDEIAVHGSRVSITARNADPIVGISLNNSRFVVEDANTLTEEVLETLPYVRFECWGPGEQFAAGPALGTGYGGWRRIYILLLGKRGRG